MKVSRYVHRNRHYDKGEYLWRAEYEGCVVFGCKTKAEAIREVTSLYVKTVGAKSENNSET